jgi:hypothetical protein
LIVDNFRPVSGDNDNSLSNKSFDVSKRGVKRTKEVVSLICYWEKMEVVMNRKCFVLLAVSLLCLTSITAHAQDSLNIKCLNEYYHNWQSGVYDVCVRGDYAYMACGQDGMYIADVSNPNQIVELSRINLDEAYSIAISGNYVFLGCYYSGVHIIDVSNPATPLDVRSVSFEGNKSCIRISGNYIFVCTIYTSTGLTIIDISDPSNAYIVSQPQDLYEVNDLEIRGDTAYAACKSQGLQVLDISDITAPRIISNFDNGDGEWVNGVSVAGNYAYLACGWDGFRVVDLSNMQLVASIDSLAYGFRTRVSENFIYLSYGDPNCPLAAIDITFPITPITADIYYPPETIHNFSISDNHVYLADFMHGLRAVDISDPFYMHEDFSYSRSGQDYDVILHDTLAYVKEDYKLKIIDVADQRNPRELGYFESSWRCHAYEIRGDIAYMLEASDTALYAIDISNPAAPALMGSFFTNDDVHYSIGLYDHYAYITENYGIRILDISDPHNMTQIGYFYCSYPKNILAVFDHYLVFGQNDQSVNVLDLTEPDYPNLIGSIYLGQFARDAKVAGNKIYILSSDYFWIYDLTTWDQLSVTDIGNGGHYDAQRIEVNGDNIFLAGNMVSLTVYNVADPYNPYLSGYYRTPDGAFGLAVGGNTVILAAMRFLGFYDCTQAVGIEEPSQPAVPQAFALLPNYPNPFNAATTIKYELPSASDVKLDIFDIAGRKLQTLISEFQRPGAHSIIWNAGEASSGIYFYKIQAGDYSDTRKMILAK